MCQEMQTSAIGSPYGSVNSSDTQSTNGLDKDAFLRILVTQLANQNPLEPADDTEFIAQLAQFSALEQMQSLNASTLLSQAYSLVGKYVTLTQTGGSTGETVAGKVDGVLTQDGIQYILVGGQKYELSSVSGVLDPDAAGAGLDDKIIQSAGLIGMTVSAKYDGDSGSEQITGKVEKLLIRDGNIFAVINGSEVPVGNIEQISLAA
jgi:flagellar basal-body rod modification protein FlgD